MVGFQQSSAPAGYLLVDGMPVTAQLSGHFLNSAAGLADLPGCPPSRPGGQQRPLRGDLRVLFGERTNFAGLVGALPSVFPPAQPGGPPERGKIDQHPPPGCLSTTDRHRRRGARQRTSTSTPPPRVHPPPRRRLLLIRPTPRRMRVGLRSTGVLLTRECLSSVRLWRTPPLIPWIPTVRQRTCPSSTPPSFPKSPFCSGSLPYDPAVKQEPEPVVVPVAVSVADAAGFLDEQVKGFGGSVGDAGQVVVEGFGLPGPQRAGQPVDLRHGYLPGPVVEVLEPCS